MLGSALTRPAWRTHAQVAQATANGQKRSLAQLLGRRASRGLLRVGELLQREGVKVCQRAKAWHLY